MFLARTLTNPAGTAQEILTLRSMVDTAPLPVPGAGLALEALGQEIIPHAVSAHRGGAVVFACFAEEAMPRPTVTSSADRRVNIAEIERLTE